MFPPVNADILTYSPLEARIITYLLAHPGWQRGCDITRGIGEVWGDRTKALLTNLADRNAIDSCPGRGYRIHEN